MMRLKHLLLCFCLVAVNNVYAGGPWGGANLAIVKDHVVPRYQQLAKAAAELQQQSESFCAAPSAKGMDQVRAAYNVTMDGWAGVQHLRFGPVELLNRYHRFQLWPDKHNTATKQIARLLTGDDKEVLQPDNFSRTSVAVQGLSALERLLYSNKGLATFVGDDKGGRRCQVVVAISRNLATMAADLHEEWSSQPPPFHLLFLSSGDDLDKRMRDRHLGEKKEVTTGFYSNLYTQVQSIIDQKLERPMGEGAGKAKERYLESWRSHRSLRNIQLNLEAVESLYDTGFAMLLKDKNLHKEIKQAFADSQAAVKAIKQPLSEALMDKKQGYSEVKRLLERVRALQALLTGPLPKALDLPLGFNALDGD